MRKLTVIFVIVVFSLVWTASLTAQESIQGQGLIVSPRQLSVAGMQGHKETRTLLIRAGVPVTDLRIVPLDLSGPDGDTVLPAHTVGVDVQTTSIPSGGLLTVPITFDLAGVSSGQFAGELLITYSGQSFTVPVSVAVKDPPWLALAALVVGVTLGIGVSAYRAHGRPHDTVLVRLGQIRTQMKADVDLQKAGVSFYNRIDAYLVDVEVALEAQQWEKAQQAVMEAEKLWVRWRRGRPDWLVQLAYYDTLMVKLNELGNVFYVNEIREAARNAHRAMANLDDPDSFRASLEPLARQINDFIALRERIDVLGATRTGGATARALQQRLYALAPANDTALQSLKDEVENAINKAQVAHIEERAVRLVTLSAELPEPHAQAWQPKIAALQDRVEALTADDPTAYLEMESEIDAALEQVTALAATVRRGESLPPVTGDVSFSGPKSALQPESGLSSPPAISVQTLPEKMAAARQRLSWFTGITYGVAVVFLALAGFVELYGGRIDFGAKGITDYFTLLVWGFGAEATRASIAEMVQGWSISARK